jgi:hypothetical protein
MTRRRDEPALRRACRREFDRRARHVGERIEIGEARGAVIDVGGALFPKSNNR